MILIHAFRWMRVETGIPGLWWPGCEGQFHEFAMYYGLQELSVKAAAWNLMRTGEFADRGRFGVIGTVDPGGRSRR